MVLIWSFIPEPFRAGEGLISARGRLHGRQKPPLFATAQPPGCERLPGCVVVAFARSSRVHEGGADPLVHYDIVQIAEAHLQFLQSRYKSLPSACSFSSREGVSEELAGIAELLRCNPHLMSLPRMERVEAFSRLH